MPPASSRRCSGSATGWGGHVTRERRQLASPLGRRLLAAFVLVALSSVAVLTVAALVGTDRGLASAHRSERARVAGRVAAAVGTAYADANGWAGADLSTASAIADAAAARRFAAGDRAARARLDAPGELGELGEVAHAFDTMADEVVRAETVRRPRPPTWPTSYVPRSPRCRPAWRNYATACANPTRGWPPCTTRRYGSAAWWPTWPTCPPPSPPPCRCARRTPTSPRSPGRRWPPSAHSWTRRACASTPT